jgi:hypothetical protein
MMKNLAFIFIAMLLITGLYSCKKSGGLLDAKINTELNEETVFSDSTRTMGFLFNIYTDIAFSFTYSRWNTASGTPGLSEACDESVHRLSSAKQRWIIVALGSVNASDGTPYLNEWTTSYKNIRKANLYMKKVNGAPLSAALKKQSFAEARFLRAWYYSILLRNFGGVPIVRDTVYQIADEIEGPRNSYEECVNYISSECDAAANDLPLTYDALNYGRVTKGACLALKSRVLLAAASPLFNGGNYGITDAQKKVVGYSAYDVNRWALAAKAAQDLIDLNVYSLYEDNVTAPGYGFSRMFLMRKNPEFILEKMDVANKTMEQAFGTPSTGSTTTNAVPTQNLTEAFGMINGKPITDPTSGFVDQDPYKNRDPRFNYTFMYNGTLWYTSKTGTKTAINTTYLAPLDGYGVNTYHTGYFFRKMLDDNTAFNGGPNTERCRGVIRYAEILLNYAEAINETGQTQLAYPKLILIRKRAGILPGSDGLYGLKANMTVDEMRKVIMNERQVELAVEDHRFWDVRRWKTAPANQNVLIKGMKITKVGSTFKYEILPVAQNAQHVFFDRMYLFPIHQSQLGSNPNLIQNPGY